MGIQTPNGFNLDNSGKRIVVDPVTRIEGHMRVEVNVDADNVIRNAVSTGTMWRGIEVIRSQEEIGLDILVDGELYRGDMTTFFAERMDGFQISNPVRSYGNRYYRKPVATGPVARNLFDLYEFMHKHLVQANVRKDIALIDDVIGLLKELLPAWEQAIAASKVTPIRAGAAA